MQCKNQCVDTMNLFNTEWEHEDQWRKVCSKKDYFNLPHWVLRISKSQFWDIGNKKVSPLSWQNFYVAKPIFNIKRMALVVFKLPSSKVQLRTIKNMISEEV